MQQAELAALRLRAERELTKIPDVLGVGYGRKEVQGKLTRQAALRVYVREKRSPEVLMAVEMIPIEFEGVPTDVVVVIRGCAHAGVDSQEPPLLTGGMTITNFKNAPESLVIGTLGFFATPKGVAAPQNVVLVSNNHVLMAEGAAVGDPVFHPRWRGEDGTAQALPNTGYIGEIDNAGKAGYHEYAYANESAREYYVDCATAKLDLRLSSGCHTNSGVSYKNEVKGLAIGGNSQIEAIARVSELDADQPGEYVVFKVGQATGLARGDVIDAYGTVDQDDVLIHGVMIVAPLDPYLRFSDVGDSGSAVINEQNQLVGLLFGGAFNGSISWASHIEPVIDFLNIQPITTVDPPVGPAEVERSREQFQTSSGC